MKVSFAESSYILNFFNNKLNSNVIKKETLKLVNEKILTFPKNENLDKWEIEFRIIYYYGDIIKIFRKAKSDSTDNFKQIVIHIPIPLNSIYPWGIAGDQIVNFNNIVPDPKYCDVLQVDYEFKSLEFFIIGNLKKAIIHTFNLGFSVGGVTIGNKMK